MSNHFKIPFCNPFKFVPNSSAPGVHFDDRWAHEQIKSFERKVYYKQKWKKTDTTMLYVQSSIAPMDLIIIDPSRTIVKTIPWTSIFVTPTYGGYRLVFDISDLDDGIYFAYQRVSLLSINWEVLSEPIHSKADWPDTAKFVYNNSFNDFDVAFTGGVEFTFRCEAAIMEYDFLRNVSDYVNQLRNTVINRAIPYREATLLVGDAPGVAPWVVDILNRIFCCDRVLIEGMRFVAKSGQNGKIQRTKGYPLVGWSQDITPAINTQSLEFADATPLAPGIILAYNMDTGVFGPGSLVPILELIKN